MLNTHRTGRRSRLMGLAIATTLAVSACGNSSDGAVDATPAPTDSTADSVESTDTTPESEPTDSGPADTTTASDPVDSAATTDAAPAGPELGEFQAIEGVPGVTDDQIGVGIVGTGAANPLGYCLLDCWADGVQAYFDYRNSIGGVHGRDLVVTEKRDDDLGNNQVATLELIESPDVFAIFSAPIIYPGLADAAAAGVPLYTTVPAAAESAGFDSIFQTTGTTCISCLNPIYIQAGRLVGATKVASLAYGVSQASKDCSAAHVRTFEAWGPAVGMELVYQNDDLAFGLPNGLAPEVTAMKDAGVDFVLTCVDQGGALILGQELERQGMTDTKVNLPQGYSDDEFAQSNAAVLEGDIVGTFFHPYEATPIPELETFLEWAGDAPINDYTMEGWIAADQMVTGLLAAGPQFDRATVISATNEINDYTANGLIPPIDWTKAHTPPTPDDEITNAQDVRCSAYVTVENGAFVLQGDPDLPFFCFEGGMTEWTEPTQQSFG